MPVRPGVDACAKRAKRARKAAGITAATMAAHLRISIGRYKRYELTDALPSDLLVAFCVLARCSPYFILTGHELEASALTIAGSGNVVAPRNMCGAPCIYGKTWCRPDCPKRANPSASSVA